MATKTYTKTITYSQNKYLAHGTAGSIYPSDLIVNFSNVLPSDATFSSVSFTKEITDSKGLFKLQYSYFTDGESPTSGTGYTYREPLTTDGLNTLISRYGYDYSKGFGVYMNFKNTSSNQDYTITAKLTFVFTYTVEEPDDPTPVSSLTTTYGDCSYIQDGQLTAKMIKACYGNQWYAFANGTVYYKDANLGLIKLQGNPNYSTNHFNYKITQLVTNPAQGDNVTATTGTIDSQSYDFTTGLYTIKSSSETLVINIKMANLATAIYYSCFDSVIDTTNYSLTVSLPNGYIYTNKTGGKGMCSAATWDTGTTFTYTNITGAQQTYVFGVLFVPFVLYSLTSSNDDNILTKLDRAAVRQYFRVNATKILNKVNGDMYDNATGWASSNFPKTRLDNAMLQLTFPSTSANAQCYMTTSFVNGHTYLCYYDIYSSAAVNGTTYGAGVLVDNTVKKTVNLTAGWQRVYCSFNYTGTTGSYMICPYGTTIGCPTTGSVILSNVNFIDITETGKTDYSEIISMNGDCQYIQSTRV